MNNNTTQEKQKSNTIIKILSAILCVVMIVSIIFNVYQFNVNNTLRSEIAVLQSETETLKTDRDTLNKEIVNKQTTVSDLSLQIEDLNTAIETLKAENQGLSDSLKSLEDGINSTHTDVILGDDEYKGDNADIDDDYRSMYTEEENEAIDKAIDEAIDEILEEYYQSNPTQAPATGYQGPPVGTPDNGVVPPSTFGQGGDSGVPAGTVY